MKVIKRSGLLIPKKYQYDDFYIKIREFLERRVQEYNRSSFIINKFYIESERFLLIPRNFPLQQYTYNYEIDDFPIIPFDIIPKTQFSELVKLSKRISNSRIKSNYQNNSNVNKISKKDLILLDKMIFQLYRLNRNQANYVLNQCRLDKGYIEEVLLFYDNLNN